MGLVELGIILFLLITIGQYVVAWAAYYEKRYTYVCKKNYLKLMDVTLLCLFIIIYVAGTSFGH